MSYSISSDKFQDPLLKLILEKLTGYFSETNTRFYLIGATARDIMMSVHNEKSGRATRDLDIAIAISDWDEYKTVEKGIVNIEGFKKDKNQKQRFIFLDSFPLDIVPFGDIKKQDDKIFWPPDETIAMSVLGFSEVGDATFEVEIDKELIVNIASLAGIFVLKLVAWSERHLENNKDADDMAFIINNYLNINEKRAVNEYYELIYLSGDYTISTAGAKLLGIDIAHIFKDNKKEKKKIIEILANEIKKEDESRLINQMIETNPNFRYEETFLILKYITEGIKD